MLINDDTARSHLLAIRVPGARGAASLERLQAPSAHATAGVTFAGQTFGAATDTGLLAGRRVASAVVAAADRYVVRLPPVSAALLTLH